ncbi:polysaccharide biosynthesis protein [Cetobacterium ceti]
MNLFGELFSNKRNIVKLSLDMVAIGLGVICALFVRFEEGWSSNYDGNYLLVYVLVFLGIYLFGREPIKSWSFTNSIDVLVLIGVNIGAFGGTAIYFMLTRYTFARTVLVMTLVFTIIFQLFFRFLFRLNKSYRAVVYKNRKKKMPVLIYGAGEGGVALIRESISNINFPYKIVGLLDDDSKKYGTCINGIKVMGNFENIGAILDKYRVEGVIIAIPTIKREKIKKIVNIVKIHGEMDIKILPGLNDLLLQGELGSQIRDVNIEDLLGREQIQINGDNIKELIENKTVFVTGGAGSIGSELARQICKYNPKKLITIDVNENTLYFLELELKRKYMDLEIISEICNIREKDKIELLFSKYRPNIVFHAAAHKHVPLMEHNPEEAIKNNIFGTKNVVDSADKYDVERFVLISTDKAVNPTNVMGATKRGCELVVEHKNKVSKTKYMAVRFGNVLGSNGSVIPIFKNLIGQGKNLTLTHPDITRYFMTIPEAAQLVIEAGTIGEGGEVFILDMGEPVKIMELAKTMIKLSNADVGIDIVGLRPGEKLYEELLYDVNAAEKTSNKKIFITKIDEGEANLEEHLMALREAVKIPVKEELKELMKRFIISYHEPSHHKNSKKMVI